MARLMILGPTAHESHQHGSRKLGLKLVHDYFDGCDVCDIRRRKIIPGPER